MTDRLLPEFKEMERCPANMAAGVMALQFNRPFNKLGPNSPAQGPRSGNRSILFSLLLALLFSIPSLSCSDIERAQVVPGPKVDEERQTESMKSARRSSKYEETADPPALRFDLARGLAEGSVILETNDIGLTTDALFDDNLKSLAKSNGINPLVLTFKFTTPLFLKAVRVYPTYSTYDLSAQPDLGEVLTYRLAEPHTWTQLEWAGKAVTSLKLEIERLQRDNFVHVNEIQLFEDPEMMKEKR